MTVAAGNERLVEVGMPRLSDSMEAATVLRWLKRADEGVARGEPLVEVETDKATIVYESEYEGVLAEILVDEGESALLGVPIALIRLPGDGPVAPAPPPVAPPEETPASVAPPARAPAERRATKPARPRATPVARRLAAQLGVALDSLAGSGPGGRIVGADVRAARRDTRAEGETVEVELTTTQQTIARRMVASRSSIPEFTLELEIGVEAALRLRADLRAEGFERVPSLNDLVIRAVALALRAFPALNATYEEGKVLRHRRVSVGMAVATDDALFVPAIRDTDRKSIFEIAAETRRLAGRARRRALSSDDLAGGTFTVSNLGMFGIRRFNAVINHPQAAILAVGAAESRAVVEEGRVVARETMEVALSCDHRVVYGAEAARFLARVRELLERPTLLVVEQEEP